MPIAASSLNKGDCFVLDQISKLYVWCGPEANMFEKKKAGDMATVIRSDERGMKAEIIYPEDASEEIQNEFWELLGGKPAEINPAIPDDAPTASEDERLQYKLWHISDDSGEIVTTEVTDRPLKRSHLSDSDSYILELYDTVYIWQGKDSSAKEKYAGMKIAKDFVKKNNKPKGTKITRTP